MKTTVLGLATFLLVSLFFVSATTSISNRALGEYDPWCDIDDDGDIDIFDVVKVAGLYGTSGEPFEAEAAIEYDSGWINITDKCGEYFNIAHNLNSTDIIVDIIGRTSVGGGNHQMHIDGASRSPGWTKIFGGAGWDEAYAIIQTGDRGFIIAGETTSFGVWWNRLLVNKDRCDWKVGVDENVWW